MKIKNIFRGKKENKITNEMVVEKINELLKEVKKSQSILETQIKYGDMWFDAISKADEYLKQAHKAEIKLAEANKEIEFKDAKIEEMRTTYYKREKVPADRSKGTQKMSTRTRQKQSAVIKKVKEGV